MPAGRVAALAQLDHPKSVPARSWKKSDRRRTIHAAGELGRNSGAHHAGDKAEAGRLVTGQSGSRAKSPS